MSDIPTNDEPDHITRLRDGYEAAQARVEELETEKADADKIARENVFLRAGVDLDSELGKLMFDGYKGDLNADAVKAYAETVGAGRPATPGATAEQLAEQREREGLTGDIPPPIVEESPDPWEAGYKEFNKRVAKGATRENAAAEVFDRVIDAAARGDERVLFDSERWREEFASP